MSSIEIPPFSKDIIVKKLEASRGNGILEIVK
jgi:hypothetical protein